MGSDPEKPSVEIPAPSLRARLITWFGIYFAGAFIVSCACNWHNYFYFSYNLNLALFYLPQTALLFPFGFAGIVGLFDGLLFQLWQIPLDSSEINNSPITTWSQLVSLVFLVGGPVTYIVHLRQTWKAKTRSRFRYLMLALVVLVSINLVGCFGWTIPERKTRYYPERVHH